MCDRESFARLKEQTEENTKQINDAAILSASLRSLLPKKSGIVALAKYWLIMRVLLPSTAQAISEPINALPSPAHVAAIP